MNLLSYCKNIIIGYPDIAINSIISVELAQGRMMDLQMTPVNPSMSVICYFLSKRLIVYTSKANRI
ncbi:hypothetical protein NVIRPANT_00878 [Pantoea sp. Nvir]|nr:hypothetical protein NVIRPANT_00878 [Pantoea sp. Nvir]